MNKAEQILHEVQTKHKHRMADDLYGQTLEMVLDAINEALSITAVVQAKPEKVCDHDWAEHQIYEGMYTCRKCHIMNNPFKQTLSS